MAGIVEFPSGSIGIKSVQVGTVSITGGASTGTATITSVNTGKSFLLFEGFTNSSGVAPLATEFPRIDLTNATTVTATRSGTPASTTIAAFTVVEMY